MKRFDCFDPIETGQVRAICDAHLHVVAGGMGPIYYLQLLELIIVRRQGFRDS